MTSPTQGRGRGCAAAAEMPGPARGTGARAGSRPGRGSRRRRLQAAVTALALPVAALIGCRPEPTGGSSAEAVVVVSIDTARRDHLSVYGYPKPTTPNLEVLARDSVVFDQAIAVHTNTAPAHASILTGLYPPRHGSINNGVPILDNVVTLAETLADHGFATGAFVSGKTLKAEFCGLDRGFHVYDDHFDGWERRAEQTLSLARRWLEGVDPDRPLFLFFHLFDPHFLYSPPEAFSSFGLDDPDDLLEPKPVQELRKSTRRDTESWRRNVTEWTRRYDAEIAYDDWAFGELLATLHELGRYRRSTIVVVSDHGESLAERPRVFDHGGRVSEEQIRVPLIVKLPGGLMAGTKVPDQVSQVDIVPTILARHGVRAPAATDGIDLCATRPDPGSLERPVFCMARREPRRLRDLDVEIPEPGRWDSPRSLLASVRMPPYKLVDYAFLADRDLRRLRHLDRDPMERSFIASDTVASRYGKVLDSWWASRWSGRGGTRGGVTREGLEMLEALGYLDPDDGRSGLSTPGGGSPDVFGNGFESGGLAGWSANDGVRAGDG